MMAIMLRDNHSALRNLRPFSNSGVYELELDEEDEEEEELSDSSF